MLTGGIKFAGTAADKVGSIDKLSYIGESVLDLVNEGKILGGLITVGEDGQTTVTMTEIDVEGKTPEEVEKELEKAGLSLPEDEEAKTAAELAEEMEEEYFYTEEEINEIIEDLRQLLYDMFLEQEPEEEVDENPADGGLPLEELLGTYLVKINFEDESESLHYTFMFYEGHLIFKPEVNDLGAVLALPAGPYEYDPATATATCDLQDFGFSKVNFISNDGMIHFSSVATLHGENTVTAYGEGSKID